MQTDAARPYNPGAVAMNSENVCIIQDTARSSPSISIAALITALQAMPDATQQVLCLDTDESRTYNPGIVAMNSAGNACIISAGEDTEPQFQSQATPGP